MIPALVIERAAPVTTIQDQGRPGMLAYGMSASGPMDRVGFEDGARMLATPGRAAIEFTIGGVAFRYEGPPVTMAGTGGNFNCRRNGKGLHWPTLCELSDGDRIDITPGERGNYGYMRFDMEIDLPAVLGSQATNSVAHVGGFLGRGLLAGDRLGLRPSDKGPATGAVPVASHMDGALRVLWGVHADLFSPETRAKFLDSEFIVSNRLDRMGMRLLDPAGIFADEARLSLVSEAIAPGDIQILGDGTPIVLMRDHQPTGGYPRIATVISADLDRLAQTRPGAPVRFVPVTLDAAQRAGRAR